MKNMLLARKYVPKILDNAIDKVRQIPRAEALKKVVGKKNKDRIPLIVTYHPALPKISAILRNAWTVMVKDNHMKTVFPKPPMVAFK